VFVWTPTPHVSRSAFGRLPCLRLLAERHAGIFNGKSVLHPPGAPSLEVQVIQEDHERLLKAFNTMSRGSD
jgi:hypothetical protein